jgi:hemoglobin
VRDPQRPAPTRDLDSPEEITEMVRRFYADVAMDDILGPMFNDVARVDWSEHLPKLTAFWCRALLDLPGYVGNPFRSHALVHDEQPFTSAHFQRWLSLFHETLDLGWAGPKVERAHQLADNVARVHSEQLIGRAVALDAGATSPAPARAERPGTSATGAAGHLDLLAIARDVRDAVERDDTDALHAELTRLRAAVMDHVHAERPQLDALTGSAAVVVVDGQQRLLRLLTEVLFTPTDQDGADDCNCLVRAAEIDLALRRQAKLEGALLRRHVHARTSGT